VNVFKGNSLPMGHKQQDKVVWTGNEGVGNGNREND